MEMSNAIDRMLAYYFSLPEERRAMIHRRSSPFDDLVYISLILRKNNVVDAIEIGTFLGLSACFIASNITGRLYTYNVSANEMEVAKTTVAGAGLNNIEFIVGDSLAMLPQCPAFQGELGAVYIDGHHSYRYSMGEYRIVEPHIRNGIVLFDDADKPHPDGAKDGGVLRTIAELGATKIDELRGRVAYKTFGEFKP